MHVAGHKQRPPIHPLERWLLAVLLLQLVFMPWAFGTMHVWSQLTALALSLIGFGLALLPRFYSTELTQGAEFHLRSWPRLVRFPLFWLGLGLLILMLLQASNPFWVWERNTTSWWLRRVTDIEWLPVSIDTPFERFDLWRQFIIYATGWLTVCALWIGITRRKTMHLLLGALVINACILGLVGFVQKATGQTKLLWLREFPDAASFASFIYQNHGGAYFGLLSFLALGLSVWHFFEGRKRMARSTPAALWLIASLLLVFAVIFSLSRGAILSTAVFAVAALIALLILRFTTTTASTVPTIVPVMIAVGVLGTIGWMVRQVDFSEVYYKFEQLSKLQANDPSVVGRRLAHESAAKMLEDHWVRGVGAGGFRFLFPEYIKNKPLIYAGGTLFWEHAHNDWLEIPIELGLAGVLLLMGGAGWIVWTWSRSGGWKHPLVLMVFLGAGQVMVHAFMDFPFQNPAILTTWLALLVIGLRWLELDTSGSARSFTR